MSGELGNWDDPDAEPDFGEDEVTPGVVRAGSLEAAGEGEGQPEEPPAPYYSNLGIFVSEYLFPLYRRDLDSPLNRWCEEWWKHEEAQIRLDALWRAWEHLRLDAGTGPSVWLRDHLDHHMTVLLAADGPFARCKADKHEHELLEQLPSNPPPRLFED